MQGWDLCKVSVLRSQARVPGLNQASAAAITQLGRMGLRPAVCGSPVSYSEMRVQL